MVTHIVGWTFREDLIETERARAAERIKTELEALVGVVPGLLTAHVATSLLPSSSLDLALVSTLADEEALAAYRDHPAHRAAAEFVGSVRGVRHAIDFIME